LLAAAPDLPADNALPRWLDEQAGRHVLDLRRSWRLAFDLDSPADVLLLASAGVVPARLRTNAEALSAMAPLAVERFAAVTGVLHDRGAELLVAGRVSADTVRRLETGSACRIRALVEERGLRASSPLATAGGTRRPRPPRSVLAELLDRDGPAALGTLLAWFADGAVVDTRVLLAHRLGADERLWPAAEDRFASDLLLPDAVADPWLRSLTEAAAAAPIPIVLGGHTSVNAGLRLLAGRSEGRR
jgi:hypothetical protein